MSCHVQAINGGTPTYLGIPVPFSLSTLLAIVCARPPSFPACCPLDRNAWTCCSRHALYCRLPCRRPVVAC